MAKYFKNVGNTHVPLDPEEKKIVEEEYKEFMDEIKETGQTLKESREEMGWTQEQLAEMVGMDVEHIEMLETGKQPIPVATAKRFGEVFQKDHEIFLWR